ncbi:MAG: DUF4870 domain-containing protein [Anaerolineae bacterium]
MESPNIEYISGPSQEPMPLPAPSSDQHFSRPLTQGDRIIAAIAHASVWLNLFTAFLGIAVAGGIWLLYRSRQRWVAGQALQALFLQFGVLALIVATMIFVGLGKLTFWTIIGLLFFPLACATGFGVIALFLYSIFGAVQALAGRDFRYPIIGVVADD